jgi:hypothetical protein
MPVQILEVVVRAILGNPNGGGSNNSTATSQETVPREELIKESVNQVMDIIKDKMER